MAIKFRVVLRKNPITKAAKYYPSPVHTTRVEQSKIVAEIAEQSALTTADVKACIDRLQYIIIHHLLEGQSVKLDDLGTFSITLDGKGSDSVKACKADTVQAVRVRFLPATTLKEHFNVKNSEVTLERVITTGDGTVVQGGE